MKTLIILLLSVTSLFAQEGPGSPQNKFGGYAQVTFETIYTKPFAVSVGLRFRETRVGYFYQQAVIPHQESLWVRKGIFVEQGLFNVEKFAYLYVGARVLTTNEQFVQVVPHFGMSFRFKRYVEIPLSFSTYKGYGTGFIGVRFLL